MSAYPAYTMGGLCIVGGVSGFARTRSVPSLVAGVRYELHTRPRRVSSNDYITVSVFFTFGARHKSATTMPMGLRRHWVGLVLHIFASLLTECLVLRRRFGPLIPLFTPPPQERASPSSSCSCGCQRRCILRKDLLQLEESLESRRL